ncbi:hypothetical protein DSO57_1005284 [Entomophthora muscae]|uniref:Uncharacterized protein n=1 Tax=Entomophthora muscae TaxID=34485 RepID=A0ACC2TIN3_9FUNG|nr:hypothetical protein DSO57_1005284 [Entomophthora muscae]
MRLVLLQTAVARVLLGGLEFETFSVLQSSPPDFKQETHHLIAPELDPFTCQLNLDSVKERRTQANYTSLVIIPTANCHDYLTPLADFLATVRRLAKRDFPPFLR